MDEKTEHEYIRRDIERLEKSVAALAKDLRTNYVSKESNWVIRAIVIGLAGLALTAFAVSGIAIILGNRLP